jgi:hypothetical protein
MPASAGRRVGCVLAGAAFEDKQGGGDDDEHQDQDERETVFVRLLFLYMTDRFVGIFHVVLHISAAVRRVG